MKISVIIPVYNAENYIRKCLNSVINQTYNNWEILAIDDGSVDSSYKILSEYAEMDSRIHIETKKNEGPGLTRNRALNKASGDYIVFLDSDDYIEPDYFDVLVKTATEKCADIVFIDVIQEDTQGRVIKFEKMSRFSNKSRKGLIGCQMSGYMPWGGWRKAASRALIENHNLRYTSDPVGEEAIFSFELLRNANKICFIPQNLYHYVNHPGSQSKVPNGTWQTTLQKMKIHLEINNIYNEYSDALNSFAFIVMVSNILRFAKNNSVLKTWKQIREYKKEFATIYGWNLCKEYLRKDVRFLIPLFKMNFLLLIALAAKLFVA